jgi:hypothetical protein
LQALINKTIPLKYYDFEGPTPTIIGDTGTTASGALRSDIAHVRNQWKISCKKLSNASWMAIYNYLNNIMFAETLFWCEDFDGTADTNSKYVRILIENPKLVQFGRGGVWEKSGRDLTLTITESR